ncbi:unknown [Firmicutes bacterium CAG:238]|nr:unknown [Firmicutes bacterium CAG:238]
MVGSFKPANPLFVCACKSTFFVPEKLGFQSTFTENLTVYRDKMPGLSGTQIMDILCGNFFADAGFAQKQNVDVGVRNLAAGFEKIPISRTFAL